MNIREAVLKAKEQGKGIIRESELENGSDVLVFPTNRKTCCLLIPMGEDKKVTSSIGNNWNPTLDDLIAIDWILEE